MAARASCPVTLTDSAVKHFLSEDTGTAKDLRLRVFASGSGCSGLVYGFQFDEAVDGDTICSSDDLTVVIDKMSTTFLMGVEVDYSESTDKTIIITPNCGTITQ